MSKKIWTALVAALVVGSSLIATAQDADARHRRHDGWSGYHYGQASSGAIRDRVCATGCGGF